VTLSSIRIQHSDLIVNKKLKKYTTQKKPQPPDLRAQIKLHKPSQPIRPVVNNRNAPAYKIAKLLVNKLNNLINLRNHYIVKDSTALANDLTKLKIDENHRMITLDIKDLYVNIPIQETLWIAKNLLLENNNEHTSRQMITLLEVTLHIFHSVIFTNLRRLSLWDPPFQILLQKYSYKT